jgi:hypothetical protein
MNDEDMCGRFIYVHAYLKDPEKEGEYKQWKHNRFRWFDRQVLNDELIARKSSPWLINQKQTNTCGPSAIIMDLLKQNRMKIYLISLAISIVVMIVSTFVLYFTYDYIYPPITLDGHRYMPTSNVLKALFFSFLLSILIFYISIRIQKKKLS